MRHLPLLLLLWLIPGDAQVNILTANGDTNRTNANLQETQLSPATVNATSFGKLATLPVDGQIYAQPLYASGLTMADGQTHNVVFLSTMHNSVYAYDADAVSPISMLWQVNLGPPVPAALLFGPYGDISVEVGVLSTGAIDLTRGVIYVVADVLQNGGPVFYLHALDLATGAERLNGPVELNAALQGSGTESRDDGTLPFVPMQHIQRPGLLLANGTVFVSFGSHADQNPYHGWMLGYDAGDLSHQVSVYNTTPDGNAGAIWQSGRGPAVDPDGNIYIVTGNGDYDGMREFGESFVKLSPAGTDTLDSFTPTDWKSMSDNDFDLSAGPALINGTATFLGADKLGNLYAIDGGAMNQPGSASIVQASTGSIFNFAVWSSADGSSANVYTQGGNEPLKQFLVTGQSISPDPVSTTTAAIPYARVGMTLSANGNQPDSGILWGIAGDYNLGKPGTLHAYDASNLANEVWNSDMNSARDQLPPITKFVSPMVANGRVYVPTNGNVVLVYGLLAPPPPPPAAEHPAPHLQIPATRRLR